MAGKYKVAEGASFVNSGVVYKPGDEISPGIFTDRAVFDSQIASGRIICVEPEVKKTGKGLKGKGNKGTK